MRRTTSLTILQLGLLIAATVLLPRPMPAQNLTIDRTVLVTGNDDWDWTQARTAVSTDQQLCVTTMSRTARTGSHGYHDVYLSISRDRGITWSEPAVISSLRRRRQADDCEVVAGDLWPHWHSQTGVFLITGKTFNFDNGTRENILKEKVAYAVLDPETLECGPLRTVTMPPQDSDGHDILAPNAGCHQVIIQENNQFLIPIRYQQSPKRRIYTSIVARCRFDGTDLTYESHGTQHSIPTGRGLYEPSVTCFKDRCYLTMRADDGAWVAVSSDGTH